jgi:hypothetical protein
VGRLLRYHVVTVRNPIRIWCWSYFCISFVSPLDLYCCSVSRNYDRPMTKYIFLFIFIMLSVNTNGIFGIVGLRHRNELRISCNTEHRKPLLDNVITVTTVFARHEDNRTCYQSCREAWLTQTCVLYRTRSFTSSGTLQLYGTVSF